MWSRGRCRRRWVVAGIEPLERLRAPGAGGKPAMDSQPGLLEALDELVWPETRGHPESPLRWTLTSTYELARQLTTQGCRMNRGAGAALVASDGVLVAGHRRSRSKERRIRTVMPSSST